MKCAYIVLLILIDLLVFSSAKAFDFCNQYQKPKTYNEIKKNIELKIIKFANLKPVAKSADEVLVKLINAKSPLVSTWLNKYQLADKSEIEIAKAWRIYFVQNYILAKYPQEDAKINSEVEKLVDQILKETLNNKFKKKMQSLFVLAQNQSIKIAEGSKIEKKADLVRRIKALKLYWPKNLKSARNNANPLDIINWGIAYDPVPNEINMGIESLVYTNDETYIAVFAHEIGHSFDSCRWGAFFNGPWPFEKVGQCLRSEQSVAALRRDDSQLAALEKSGKLSKDLVASLKLNPTCNKLIYPPEGLQADQLPEAFADWFAAEVVARIKSLDIKKLRLDLCEEKILMAGTSYPTNLNRLEKIYFAQPILRNKIKENEDEKIKYCGPVSNF